MHTTKLSLQGSGLGQVGVKTFKTFYQAAVRQQIVSLMRNANLKIVGEAVPTDPRNFRETLTAQRAAVYS